ncbi:Uncharacterised protein [Serratia liquefaciens]|uniref:hypothetical protein n=1 Tax=Serratia liquefaciens TaxID=614 RepID=UPI002178E10E|nr:hypothetical protein [Serratia liquefaciens]CAI1193162.1 Uncharacterised protein [Serratia liquefaciens]
MEIKNRTLTRVLNVVMIYGRFFTGLSELAIRVIVAVSIMLPVLTFWMMLLLTKDPVSSDITLSFDTFRGVIKSVVGLSWTLTVLFLLLYSGFSLVFGFKNRLIPDRLRNL